MRATRGEGRTVTVTWAGVAGPVVRYRVIREGVRIGTSTTLVFSDRVPRDMRWPTYRVRAVAADGTLGPLSGPFTLRMY